eukprot:scaffold40899_cov20-Tisochrysis_lutea.AAC.2
MRSIEHGLFSVSAGLDPPPKCQGPRPSVSGATTISVRGQHPMLMPRDVASRTEGSLGGVVRHSWCCQTSLHQTIGPCLRAAEMEQTLRDEMVTMAAAHADELKEAVAGKLREEQHCIGVYLDEPQEAAQCSRTLPAHAGALANAEEAETALHQARQEVAGLKKQVSALQVRVTWCLRQHVCKFCSTALSSGGWAQETGGCPSGEGHSGFVTACMQKQHFKTALGGSGWSQEAGGCAADNGQGTHRQQLYLCTAKKQVAELLERDKMAVLLTPCMTSTLLRPEVEKHLCGVNHAQ